MDHSAEDTKSTKKTERPTRRIMREKDIDTEIQLSNPHQEYDGHQWPPAAASGQQPPRASWTARKGGHET